MRRVNARGVAATLPSASQNALSKSNGVAVSAEAAPMVTHTRRVPGGPGEAEAAMNKRARAEWPLGAPPWRRREVSIGGEGPLSEVDRSGGAGWLDPAGTARVPGSAANSSDARRS